MKPLDSLANDQMSQKSSQYAAVSHQTNYPKHRGNGIFRNGTEPQA